MERFSKKGALLFAAAMALCTLAMPSPASAGSWSTVGTEHTLDSPNFGFTATTAIGTVDSSCPSSQFTADVASTAALAFTSALFGGGCTAVFNGTQVCTATITPTNFPWTATVPTTANIQLHNFRLDQVLDQSPAGTCPVPGLNVTVTGTATNGTWSNNQREITYTDAPGMVMHSPLGNNQPVTFRGTFRDTQQTLIVRGALYRLP
jgi:hypothetical protein